MDNNPYRDSLENKVSRLEQRIEEVNRSNFDNIGRLEKRINDAKLVPSLWGTFKSFAYNVTHPKDTGTPLAILSIVGLVAVFAVGVPSCVQSCNADQQHERELHSQERSQACEALGLSFMEYRNSTNDQRDYIVCAGQERVVYINPSYPERSYARTTEQLQQAQMPED